MAFLEFSKSFTEFDVKFSTYAVNESQSAPENFCKDKKCQSQEQELRRLPTKSPCLEIKMETWKVNSSDRKDGLK